MRSIPIATLPALAFVSALLGVPLLLLGWISLHTGDLLAGTQPGLTLSNYVRVLSSPLYRGALSGTLRLSLSVTLLTLLAGYPVAVFIARSGSRLVPLVVAVTALPLFVSVVVRSFGWIVLLGRQGPISRLLVMVGLVDGPVRLLGTSGAVTVGLVHILLPLMVLPLASVLRGIDREIEAAAATLGASPWRVFRRVVLPLSLPGVGAGCVLVMAHVIAAFVLPALIGSDRMRLMATIIYQQVMVVGDLPLGAALSLLMVATSFAVLWAGSALARLTALVRPRSERA